MKQSNTERLKIVIPDFFEEKQNADFYKKKAEILNKEIKKIMKEEQIEEYMVDGILVNVNTTARTKLNEDMLIKRLKELGITKGIVRRKEYVDMEALENAIYNNKLKALQIADCQEVKHVSTLRVKKVKG